MKAEIFGHIISFLSGTMFAVGLGVSGMTDPKNVLEFLTIGPAWTPQLPVVMAVAVITMAVFVQLSNKLSKPCFGPDWTELPKPGWNLNFQMVLGNAIFGVGWGLIGYCPGPAFVSLVTLQPPAFVFVGAMVCGFLLWEFTLKNLALKMSLLQRRIF